MEEIRKLLKSNHVLTNDELRYILFILSNMLGIGEIELRVNKDIKNMMAYNIEENVIYINWEEICRGINNSKVSSINYMLVFSLIHELGHVIQKKRIEEIDDYVSHVYSVCFSFISNGNMSLVSELKKKIYVDSHDLFPTEVNADVMSHLQMLRLLKDFDVNFYEMYKYFLMDRLVRLHQNNNFRDFCEKVLGIDIKDGEYDLNESLILGLPISNTPIKEADVLKLIIM